MRGSLKCGRRDGDKDRLPRIGANGRRVERCGLLDDPLSDGINTVGVALNRRGGNRSALAWLIIDVVAPVVGAVSTLMLHFQPQILGGCLALFAGFFVYMSASDLLPESYHDHPTVGTTAMTTLGLCSGRLGASLTPPSLLRISVLVSRAVEHVEVRFSPG
jgi:hypothetical protein